MADQKNNADDQVLSNTDLAFERTVLAENRTLMAWVRTAISLISFGFTIYKFFQEHTQASHRFLTPRRVGMIMILFGLLVILIIVESAALKRGVAEDGKRGYKKLKTATE